MEEKIDLEILFAICRVLREFGYRKRSARYFVKPKDGEPVILCLEEQNYWRMKHYDFNSHNGYYKVMGDTWEYCNKTNYPVFSYFPKDGYLCTIPLENQLIAFAERKGFKITDVRNLPLVLQEIILAYRETYKSPKAFDKYLCKFVRWDKKQTI